MHDAAHHRDRRGARLIAMVAAILALAIVVAGCSSAKEESAPSGNEDGAFPVTIPSALGSVTIDKAPKRVATWGWSAQDAVLALGVVPVAMPKFSYGGGKDGILPWDAEAIDKLGGAAPQLLGGGDTGEVPFEEFASAKPDVIVAPYSGLSQKDYDTLSKIAPVVGYPDKPFATSWQDQTSIIGKVLGKQSQAKKLVEKTNASIGALAKKYSVLKGKSFVYVSAIDAGQLNIFRAVDPRVELLNQLGLVNSPSVKALDAHPSAGSYFYQTSYENVGKIDTDLVIGYFDDQKAVDAFTADGLIARMPSIKAGRFAPIVGESFVMASSAPTVLAIPWMLDRYVPQLAAIAQKVR